MIYITMYIQDISALFTKVCTPPGGRWMAPLGVIIVSCPPGPLRPSADGHQMVDGHGLDDLSTESTLGHFNGTSMEHFFSFFS